MRCTTRWSNPPYTPPNQSPAQATAVRCRRYAGDYVFWAVSLERGAGLQPFPVVSFFLDTGIRGCLLFDHELLEQVGVNRHPAEGGFFAEAFLIEPIEREIIDDEISHQGALLLVALAVEGVDALEQFGANGLGRYEAFGAVEPRTVERPVGSGALGGMLA